MVSLRLTVAHSLINTARLSLAAIQ